MNNETWRALLEVLNDWRRVDADPDGRMTVRAHRPHDTRANREDPAVLHFRLVEDQFLPDDPRGVRVALLTVARLGEMALALPIPLPLQVRRDAILVNLQQAILETKRIEAEVRRGRIVA
ncbi:MAG: hypothetical protein KF812_02300 [Fimbriimonadaceae bacterium]|nr:hypothetical protein [Fimbriimonadaceae bacterium]